jgi:hypothetical protein
MTFCYPNIFDDLIVENQQGLFRVQLFFGEQTIDDMIPCDRDGVPLFCKNSVKSMMIEKALAKYSGAYVNID